MNILDRYILRSLFVNYTIALGVVLSLRIVLDLFVNMDEFTESAKGASAVTADVVTYYSANSLLYFSELSGVITLVASTVTLARMRWANELAAVLASGVGLRRVGTVAVAFSVGTLVLWVVNAEVFIPCVAHVLARRHDDAGGRSTRGLWLVNDGSSVLLSALEFAPAQKRMHDVLIVYRNAHGAVEKSVQARSAVWQSASGHVAGGFWQLEDGVERRYEVEDNPAGPRYTIQQTDNSVYESYLGPAQLEMRQAAGWLDYLSSAQLSRLGAREPALADRVRRAKHGRAAAPVVQLLMLLLGLPFFLTREQRSITGDATACLVVCGLCYLLAQGLAPLARGSVLPAWLPLVVFAPVAAILIYRIRT